MLENLQSLVICFHSVERCHIASIIATTVTNIKLFMYTRKNNPVCRSFVLSLICKTYIHSSGQISKTKTLPKLGTLCYQFYQVHSDLAWLYVEVSLMDQIDVFENHSYLIEML